MKQIHLISILVIVLIVISCMFLIFVSQWDSIPFFSSSPPAASDGSKATTMEMPIASGKKTEEQESDAVIHSAIQETITPSDATILCVTGMVFGSNDEPLTEYRVERSIQPTPYSWGQNMAKPKWVDAEPIFEGLGRFVLNLPEQEAKHTVLRIAHEEYKSEEVKVPAAVRAADGRYHLNDIYLIRAFMIRGKVVDRKGAAVPHCSVSAPGMPWLDWKQPPNQDQGITDENGFFSLLLKKQETMRVTACRDDIGVGWSQEVQPGLGKDLPFVKIVLDSHRAIAGRILYRDGRPVEGLRLKAMSYVAPHYYEIIRKAKTDVEGRFRFPPLPDVEYMILLCNVGLPNNVSSEESHDSFVIAEHVRPGADDLFYYYPETAGLIVHLQDVEGKPVCKEPWIQFAQPYRHGKDGNLTSWKSCFDANGVVRNPEPGTYVYEHVQPGLMDVTVRVEGVGECWLRDLMIPAPPEKLEVTAVLEPRPCIECVVLHADGKPARGVVVSRETDRHFRDEDDPPSVTFTHDGLRGREARYKDERTITDRNGRFRFEDIRGKIHHLYFSIAGKEIFKKTNIEFTDGQKRIYLTITLPALNCNMTGTVRDGSGTPLPRAVVLAWDGGDLFLVTRCGVDGEFSFKGLPESRYLIDARSKTELNRLSWGSQTKRIREDDSNYKHQSSHEVILVRDQTTHVDLVIQDPCSSRIVGNVSTSLGLYPMGLRFRAQEIDSFGNNVRSPRPNPNDLFTYHTYRNDDDASNTSFRFTDLRAGRYRISVEWEDAQEQERYFNLNELYLGLNETKRLEVVLPLAGLVGKITDRQTGRPIEDATVSIMTDNTWWYSETFSDANGIFRATDLPAGTFPLQVAHPDYQLLYIPELTLEVNEWKPGMHFELVRGYTISGMVKKKGGEWGRAYVCRIRTKSLLDSNTRLEDDWTDSEGSFTLHHLPEGPLNIQILHKHKLVAERKITVPLPKDEELIFEVDVP